MGKVRQRKLWRTFLVCFPNIHISHKSTSLEQSTHAARYPK